MRLLIVGAGAIGCYLGGYLAQAGQAVTFLARPGVAAQLQAHGLRVRRAADGSSFVVRGFGVVTSAAAAFAAAAPDCVVLAIKSFDTAAAVAGLAALAPGAGAPPVLCLQNGVDNEAEIARVLGPGRVIAGTVTTPLSKPSDSEVLVEKARGLGVALTHPQSAALVAACRAAGLRARGYPAAGPMKWSKLFTNLLGSATSAILDLPVAEVYGDPRLFALERQVLRECLRVMRGYGHPVVNLPGVPVRPLAWAATRLPAALARPLLQRVVGGGRGGKLPSLHIDLHAGRARSEVGWLHGAVARHAASLGLAAPVSAGLAKTLEALHAGALDRAAFRRAPQALLERLAA